MNKKSFYMALLLLIALALFTNNLTLAAPEEDLVNYLTKEFDFENVKRHVNYLSSFKSRVVGYSGYYRALEYVINELKGNLRLWNQSFIAPSPMERGVGLTVYDNDQEINIEVHMIYPNYLIVPENVQLYGELVYVGRGTWREFDGKEIRGKIVVMNVLCENNWIRALDLGAKAVIFVSINGEFDRLEALSKIAMIPVNFPRFLVADRTSSIKLAKLALKGCKAKLSGHISIEKVRAYNIIAELKGEDPNSIIILGAHLDSLSIVPAVSPGADDSIGVAFLLELARVLSRIKPKYTVWFVVFSSHWQGLLGPRMFVEEYFIKGLKEENMKDKRFLVTICLDISSGDSKVIPSIGGFFYAHKHVNVLSRHSPLITVLKDKILTRFQSSFPSDYSLIISLEYEEGTIFTTEYAFSGFACAFILDSEPMTLAGTIGFTLVTFKDSRVLFFTPYDKFEKVNWDNVLPQLKFSLFTIGTILTSKVSELVPGEIKPVRIEIQPQGGFGFATLELEVVKYDPRVPTLYRPVPNSIVSIYKVGGWYSRYEAFNKYNIFARIIAFVNESGIATIHGVPVSAAAAGNLYIEAYKFNEETGELTYGPDGGPNGAGRFPSTIEVKYPITRAKTVVFKCSKIVLSDIILPDKPHALITLGIRSSPIVPIPLIEYESPMSVDIKILKAISFIEPESYGGTYDPVSGLAVAFIPPHERIQLIVSLTGLHRKVILLLNSTENNPEGIGYVSEKAGEQIIIPFAIMEYVKALYYLAKDRYTKAVSYGIIDPVLEECMSAASEELKKALEYYEEKTYSQAHSLLLEAWSSALKTYERSKSVNMDATNSTIPLLILVIPFALLTESLLFSLKGYKKIVAIILLSLVTFIAIRSIHPGFRIAISLPALIIGVILIVMLAPTVFFLATELSYSIGEVRKKVFGLHFLERERVGLMLSAIGVGIQNMRKRPLRSILTSTAVVLLVALLISLTSLLPMLIVKPLDYSIDMPLTGIIVRSHRYEPLSETFVEELKQLFPDWRIGERYWAYLGREVIYGSNGKSIIIKAMVAFSPSEKELIFKNVVFEEGEWFTEQDRYTCILPASIARALGVTRGSEIRVLGLRLIVKGICEQSSLESTIDLDIYPPLPLDTEAIDTSRVFDEKFRLSWNDIIIVPIELAKITPGFFISSMSLFKEGVSEEEVIKVAREIFKHFDNLAVYACYRGKGKMFSRAHTYAIFGMEFMIVPLVLVSLILITTLLGGIHERLREASIYSALGLTPTLVALMFLTEGVIYAVIGEVVGYALGALTASFFRVQGTELIGINYSSSSIVMTMGLTLAVIVASSGYPFMKIASLVTPSLERKWKPKTKPKGDIWEISLPYVFTSEREVLGFISYLKEFMEAKKIERAGTFSVVDVDFSVTENEYSIISSVRLAPFELNIVQSVIISFLKSKTEQRIYTLMRIKRRTGPYSSWLTSNLRFIDEIRKQLLTWRLLKLEERERYISEGSKLIRGLVHG